MLQQRPVTQTIEMEADNSESFRNPRKTDACVRAFQVFREMRECGIGLDIKIKGCDCTEENLIEAHMLVLCARFPFIRKTVSENPFVLVIDLNPFKIRMIRMFVDYAYTFAISACKEDLCDFLLLAYKLEVPELVEWCIHQAALWLDSQLLNAVISVAVIIGSYDLANVCTLYLSNHKDEAEQALKSADEKFMSVYLHRGTCPAEEKILSLIKWLNNQEEVLSADNRERMFARLLKWIDCSFVSEQFVDSLEETYGFILTQSRISTSKEASRNPNEYFFLWQEDRLLRINATDLNETIITTHDPRSFSRIVHYQGIIYLVGGTVGGVDQSGLESYDLRDKTWTQLSPMKQGRSCPSVVQKGGYIFVCGGCNAQDELDSAEVFSIKLQGWTNLPKMLVARRNGAIACTPDNIVIIVGGYSVSANGSIADVECLTFGSNQWQPLEPIPVPVCAVGAAYFRGRVLIAGGQGRNAEILKSVYIFEPPEFPLKPTATHLGQWTLLKAELPNPAWVNCLCVFDNAIFTIDYNGFCLLKFAKPKSGAGGPQAVDDPFANWVWRCLPKMKHGGVVWGGTSNVHDG